MSKNSKSFIPATSELFSKVNSAHEERQLIDRLRAIGLDEYVELPQIAVMGDTSSGKSSILSALSGVSFPSSDQLTTRCPTQLILSRADTFRGSVRLLRYHQSNPNTPSSKDIASEELLGMDSVPRAIEKLTIRLINEGQYISDDQIVIDIAGPELPNLTLTDLPGLVRTVGDHEDQDIIPRVRQLVDRYMRQERTIIIAVVPANVDMHNTEILQAAQEADPIGTRTIAVVTKLDLVDAGAEGSVHELLLNKKKFMHLGYHAVRCRSQKDLSTGVSISSGLAQEKAFFQDHEYWRRLPKQLWGIHNLSKRLVTILQENIRRSLPKVMDEIHERKEKAQSALAAMGTPMDTLSARRQQFCLWVNTYLKQMEAAITGEYELLPFLVRAPSSAVVESDPSSPSTPPTRQVVDARLRAVLRKREALFQQRIEVTKDNDSFMKPKPQMDVAIGDLVEAQTNNAWVTGRVVQCNGRGDIKCAEFPDEWLGASRWRFPERAALKTFIQANRGDELAIFPSYRVFCNLFRQWIDKWEQPTIQLLDDYRVHTKVVSDHVITELHATMRVEQFLKNIAADVLTRLTKSAEQEMHTLLREEYRPYTQNNRLFLELDQLRQRALEKQLESLLPNEDKGQVNVSLSNMLNFFRKLMLSNEDREAFEMEVALQAYLNVAIRRFVDTIPMRLNDLVLNKFLQEMKKELTGTTDDKLTRLLQDSERNMAIREQLSDEIRCLKKAKEEIELLCY